MLGRIWYLEGDESVDSIISSKEFIPHEVSQVTILGDDEKHHKLHKMDAIILSKILEEIAFVNRRLKLDEQISYTVFYQVGHDRVERWMHSPIVPSPIPDLLQAS
jgi:hypothetical protein